MPVLALPWMVPYSMVCGVYGLLRAAPPAATGQRPASGSPALRLGVAGSPGLRAVVCDRWHSGMALAVILTSAPQCLSRVPVAVPTSRAGRDGVRSLQTRR